MKTKTLAAALMILMSGIAIGSAQEYQNQSTVYSPGYVKTTYEDGSTTTYTYSIDRNGNRTDEQTIRTHAAPVVEPTPARIIPPYANGDFNHDGKAFTNLPKAVPVAQGPVTVINGEMTPEQVQQLKNPTAKK